MSDNKPGMPPRDAGDAGLQRVMTAAAEAAGIEHIVNAPDGLINSFLSVIECDA